MASNDKALHFTAYLILAMVEGAIRQRGLVKIGPYSGLIAFGAVIEVMQAFVGRDPSLLDAITNGGVQFRVPCCRGRSRCSARPVKLRDRYAVGLESGSYIRASLSGLKSRTGNQYHYIVIDAAMGNWHRRGRSRGVESSCNLKQWDQVCSSTKATSA